VQTAQLLNELRGLLRPTLKAWDRFNKSSGDKCYFFDIAEQKPRRTMNLIKESFESLIDLDDRLGSLERSTELSAKNVQYITPKPYSKLTCHSAGTILTFPKQRISTGNLRSEPFDSQCLSSDQHNPSRDSRLDSPDQRGSMGEPGNSEINDADHVGQH
jgi:hypothetical protein